MRKMEVERPQAEGKMADDESVTDEWLDCSTGANDFKFVVIGSESLTWPTDEFLRLRFHLSHDRFHVISTSVL